MHGPLVLAACATAALALAGCSADEPAGTVPPMDGQGRYVILLTDALQFEPRDARVPVGATVVWRVAGNVSHDVDAYPPGAEYPAYASGLPPPKGLGHMEMAPGEELAGVLSEKGTWTVFCHMHSHEPGLEPMTATIRVTG